MRLRWLPMLVALAGARAAPAAQRGQRGQRGWQRRDRARRRRRTARRTRRRARRNRCSARRSGRGARRRRRRTGVLPRPARGHGRRLPGVPYAGGCTATQRLADLPIPPRRSAVRPSRRRATTARGAASACPPRPVKRATFRDVKRHYRWGDAHRRASARCSPAARPRRARPGRDAGASPWGALDLAATSRSGATTASPDPGVRRDAVPRRAVIGGSTPQQPRSSIARS